MCHRFAFEVGDDAGGIEDDKGGDGEEDGGDFGLDDGGGESYILCSFLQIL